MEINKSEYIKRLEKRAKKNRGKEYRNLYLRISYAIAKDGHIKRVGARAFGVFIVIRTYMDREGIAYPSLRTIAYQSGCGVGTVQREIKRLIQEDWLAKEGRVETKDGKFGNTKYRIIETDLTRGSGQKGFLAKPLTNRDNGREG
ncbi:MAG TPA: helix-turn-helix domain-containing protein [bacterium]|nr:helix-turn-helix domain-containing protein [bacterium]